MEFLKESLSAAGGVQLFVQAAILGVPVRAEVVLTHGRGEHGGRYGHVAEALAVRGFRLWTYDLRGHGRSEGRRGDIPSYAALLDDLQLVIKRVAAGGGRPLFLMGHSLGGQITLNYLLQREFAGLGAVVASPYLRLAFRPPRWRLALAAALGRLWPSLSQPTPLPLLYLSRDLVLLSSFPDLDLTHDLITVRMFHEVRRGAETAMQQAGEFKTPLLLLHGASDQVTSVEATREFFERAGTPDKTLRIYPKMGHETHNEIGREEVFADILAWLEARLEGAPARGKEAAGGPMGMKN